MYKIGIRFSLASKYSTIQIPCSAQYNQKMSTLIQILAFLAGLLIVLLTLSSALSTFVLPRAARSQLNRIVFGLLRRLFDFILHFARTYPRKDAIMAYYAPIGLMLLVPTWYVLIMLGYGAMYWALGMGPFSSTVRLSGLSLLTLGFESNRVFLVNLLEFSGVHAGVNPGRPADCLSTDPLRGLLPAGAGRQYAGSAGGQPSFRAGDAASL